MRDDQLPVTGILLPAYYENHSIWMRKQKDGSFVFSLPVNVDAKLPLFSVADTGAFVQEAFNYPDLYIGKQMKVVGDILSVREKARIFQEVTGFKADAHELDHVKHAFPGAHEIYLNLKWFANDPTGLRDLPWSRRVHPHVLDWASYVRQNLDHFKNLPAQ